MRRGLPDACPVSMPNVRQYTDHLTGSASDKVRLVALLFDFPFAVEKPQHLDASMIVPQRFRAVLKLDMRQARFQLEARNPSQHS